MSGQVKWWNSSVLPNMDNQFKVEKTELVTPDLSQLTNVLQNGLSSNFRNVKVNVIDCPDLSDEPFCLASNGLGGKTRLVDVGGVPYLMPVPQRHKVYNLEKVAKLIELPDAFIIGAGAGPSHHVGVNCEMMPNIKINNETNSSCVNNTHIAKVNTQDGSCLLQKLSDCKDMCLLANLFACEGKPGKVIEIIASSRIGEENFVSCMRKALHDHFKDDIVGLGGVFLIECGKANLHVMPDFSNEPLRNIDEINQWLNFYEMKAPLVCLSVFISDDPGLDLRLEHTHCFSNHGDGGHYHNDTTPDDIVYRGYFNVAEYVYRIDRP